MQRRDKVILKVTLFFLVYIIFFNIPIYTASALSINDPCPNCGNTLELYYAYREPTCIQEGEGLATCAYCQSSMMGYPPEHTVTIPKVSHSYGSWQVDTPATCTSKGTEFHTCTVCGYREERYPSALGHNYVYSDGSSKAATCTEAGLHVEACSRCSDLKRTTISPLGHNYVPSGESPATCTQSGTRSYTCSRCNNSYSETIPATGHNYRTTVKEATCEEAGEEVSVCSSCGDRKVKTLAALGHEWEEEEKEATCEEAGFSKKTCTRCEEVEETVIAPLGHDWKASHVIKEATCEEDGQQESVCKRCEEKETQVIPKLGHAYPEEWTMEAEPTYFADGLEIRVCPHCGKREEQVLPKKNILPIVIGGGAGVSVLGGALYYFLRRRKRFLKKSVEKTAREWLEPSVESRSLVLATADEALIRALKAHKYLQVTTCSQEELPDVVLEQEPDMVLVDPCDEAMLMGLPLLVQAEEEEVAEEAAPAEEASEEPASEDDPSADTEEEEEPYEPCYGLVMDGALIKEQKELLEQYKEEGLVTGYVPSDSSVYVKVTRLVLPVMKPDLKSDEALENIGAVADLLGIPGISTALNVYISGRDIKSVLEEGELGISESATVIADIASILGLDGVESVAGLVDDVETLRDSIHKEAGAYEVAEGTAAAQDFVEVVSDLLDR